MSDTKGCTAFGIPPVLGAVFLAQFLPWSRLKAYPRTNGAGLVPRVESAEDKDGVPNEWR